MPSSARRSLASARCMLGTLRNSSKPPTRGAVRVPRHVTATQNPLLSPAKELGCISTVSAPTKRNERVSPTIETKSACFGTCAVLWTPDSTRPIDSRTYPNVSIEERHTAQGDEKRVQKRTRRYRYKHLCDEGPK